MSFPELLGRLIVSMTHEAVLLTALVMGAVLFRKWWACLIGGLAGFALLEGLYAMPAREALGLPEPSFTTLFLRFFAAVLTTLIVQAAALLVINAVRRA